MTLGERASVLLLVSMCLFVYRLLLLCSSLCSKWKPSKVKDVEFGQARSAGACSALPSPQLADQQQAPEPAPMATQGFMAARLAPPKQPSQPRGPAAHMSVLSHTIKFGFSLAATHGQQMMS